MALSIFEKKSLVPGEEELSAALGTTYPFWNEIIGFVKKNAPDVSEEWNYSGKSFGWNLRLKNTKKVLVYLTPCEKNFLISLVFGPAATEEAMRSTISDEIKELIDSAKVYAEGRGFRITVDDDSDLDDLKKLILIKMGKKQLHK